MPNWDAEHYLKYGDERTRAALDLAARIKLDSPNAVADLGCGPGNSTQILRRRWPHADVVGVDSSPEMIDAAKQSWPEQNWLVEDISNWKPNKSLELIFSNAALQWIPNHRMLIPRLFSMVAPGGALAFQIPSSTYAAVRVLVHEISREARWTERMQIPRNALTMEPPSFYYDALINQADRLDIWESEYQHVLESKIAIVDWMGSAGLRPFLGALDNDNERDDFLAELHRRVDAAYETQVDGKVLFPFRRTFVIAYR